MQIALDAMGGDHAPGPIVAGAVQAVAAGIAEEPVASAVIAGEVRRSAGRQSGAGAA